MSDAIARMFDLVPTPNGGYIIRAVETEVRQLHSVWYALHHFNQRYGMKVAVTREAVDNWLRMCNEVVDRHHLRKPLTRGAS